MFKLYKANTEELYTQVQHPKSSI